ncbi:MAG: helix-turn-helix domain-containing protein [Clostridia bacterium]|nr:helix-turn-helix domain-containing protein [Clostridia bacterium]
MVYQLHRDNEEYFRFGRCLSNLHFHRAIELIYCIKNPKPIIINSKEYTLEEGELLFVPPLVPHIYPPISSHRSLCVVMPVSYSDILSQELADKSIAAYVIKNKDIAADIFNHMCMLENCNMPLLKQSLYTYILAMSLKSLPLIEKEEEAKADFSVEVLIYIEKHYTQKLTSKSVSKSLGYNPCYFSSLFNQNLKCSFNTYLNIVRINKAIPLLGKYPTATVAEKVGFSNMQSFYQNFKKHTGLSPQEYLSKS